jgi:hypothetical protein
MSGSLYLELATLHSSVSLIDRSRPNIWLGDLESLQDHTLFGERITSISSATHEGFLGLVHTPGSASLRHESVFIDLGGCRSMYSIENRRTIHLTRTSAKFIQDELTK